MNPRELMKTLRDLLDPYLTELEQEGVITPYEECVAKGAVIGLAAGLVGGPFIAQSEPELLAGVVGATAAGGIFAALGPCRASGG
jgi:hypothetical protein